MNVERVQEIIANYESDPTASLAILQDIQREYNFLPRQALELVSAQLMIPLSQVYQLATFFKSFSLTPKGDYVFKVCLGTACHVKGGPLILEALEKKMGIKSGETTPDGKFSVEGVRCLGACALAPVMVVNEEPYGQVTQDKAVKLVDELATKEPVKEKPQQQPAVSTRSSVDLSAVPPAG